MALPTPLIVKFSLWQNKYFLSPLGVTRHLNSDIFCQLLRAALNKTRIYGSQSATGLFSFPTRYHTWYYKDLWWRTMGLRSSRKTHISIKSQSWEIWICCYRRCHHPRDGGLWAWGPHKNTRSLSKPKAEKFEFVVVVIILMMEDYGLEVLAKTTCH